MSLQNITLSDIINEIKPLKVIGEYSDIRITNFKSVFDADENSLVWINPDRTDRVELADNTKAKALICDDSIAPGKNSDKCYIVVNYPKIVFTQIISRFYKDEITYGTHPSAVIEEGALVSPKTYIGPNTFIAKNTKVDEGTIIQGNAFIYSGTIIGKNVKIMAGAVIGSDGYGYARDNNNELIKFPHIGGVIIEDDVEIGANTCIDRGALGDTFIGRGTKIDNLVHVAHNAHIGKNVMIIANAMIAGSVIIGDNAWIAPSVSTREVIKIGSNAVVGIGSLVTKNIPDSETWLGVPAKPYNKK